MSVINHGYGYFVLFSLYVYPSFHLTIFTQSTFSRLDYELETTVWDREEDCFMKSALKMVRAAIN